MISYIKGMLVEKEEDRIVVEAGSIGYDIYVPLSFLASLPPVGEEVQVYTYLQVREDAVTLYGFPGRQDLKMFRQLLGVTGIGPRGALGILSALQPDQLRVAILSGDVKTITRAPGVGARTAQRIILDLKDRVSAEEVLDSFRPAEAAAGGVDGQSRKEAADALVALGYSASEAASAVRRVEGAESMTAEEVQKASLKYMLF